MARFRRLLAACIILIAIAALVPPVRAAADRPNFLLILADDLGYGDLGCYGHPHIRTPNLDRLAAEGVRLTHCYSAAPVCSPARAGLLTGRTPGRTGVYDWIPAGHDMHLPRDEITIATLLKRAGYDTAHVGKWHLNGRFNSDAQPQPSDHGFDHWFSTQNNARPSHRNPDNFVRNGEAVGGLEGFSSHLVAEEGVRWLRSRPDPQRPFFLFVCFHEPHEPVESPDDLAAEYEPLARNRDEAEYFANVTHMDNAVGKLLAALDELRAADDTLVFFTSDNGPETLNRYPGAQRSYGSPGPLRGMKLWLYEGGIRVPGIVRFPKRAGPGRIVDEPVSAVDVLPTFCELAGVDAPADRALDGASFAPIFDGERIDRPKPLYWHYYRALGRPKAALREGPWMVLGHWDHEGPLGRNVNPRSMRAIRRAGLSGFQLYHLAEDPAQQHDLSQPDAARLERLSQRLVSMHRQVQADGPVWAFESPD